MIRDRLFPTMLLLSMLAACGGSQEVEPRLLLVDSSSRPVLSVRTPGAEDVRYGFEGGRALLLEDGFHLFTSEMVGDPAWVNMRLAHWTSPNGIDWVRQSTLFESTANFDGTDPRAAYWSPLPVFDDEARIWNLFFVAYHSAPNTEEAFLSNHKGRIVRSTSTVAGREGIGGPYEDRGVIMQPGPESDPWEGLQGVDSFFPYRVDGRWVALYGSAWTQELPIRNWLVGLAEAPSLEGPWTRLSDLNPSPIEERFIENPIVYHHRDGNYLCVYDHEEAGTIGYSFSKDGLHWAPGKALSIQPEDGWSGDIRTPMGLIPDEQDPTSFTVFFTGFEEPPDWERILSGDFNTTCAIGRIRVRLVWEAVSSAID